MNLKRLFDRSLDLTGDAILSGLASALRWEVDLASGRIRNLTRGTEFAAKPYPEFMSELIAAGGLIEHTKKRLAKGRI